MTEDICLETGKLVEIGKLKVRYLGYERLYRCGLIRIAVEQYEPEGVRRILIVYSVNPEPIARGDPKHYNYISICGVQFVAKEWDNLKLILTPASLDRNEGTREPE